MHVESISASNGHKRVAFGVEPTANYHKPLAEFLINKNYDLVLVSGVAVKRNRELLDGRWDKNDMKDSANVADLISQGKCLFYEYPIHVLRDLRGLLFSEEEITRRLNMVSGFGSAIISWPNIFLSWTDIMATASLRTWPLYDGVSVPLRLQK